ncbi:heat stress transcription factor A-1-like [Zingiber officinale]|uniref:HSF-type DNA-binding domain-containing protein n=1 Tax=Zingiber officinale TaxID=94328 RepID=A0A8J5F8S0_ZINOF|nr:heat stress transcription factor A-1-like [Zingiber officinale]KAG6481040.1 hypothetical protein ZIOFF_057632 [Zingiber officinale]
MVAAKNAGGEAAPTAATVNANLVSGAPPPFLSKTYEMVDDLSTNSIVSWGDANNNFVVWNPPEFARNLLPKYFKHDNFSSFVRQLNTYGFRKVDPDQWEFANEGFLRGQKHLLKTINRRKTTHTQNQPQELQTQNATGAACVELGKFGLVKEIERLKRDKNVLMQELDRLRQQQQSTDHHLKTLVQRLQGMEHHQQQMMSFLAKAMQNPGFLSQFVQQNDSSQRIAGVNKKRRYPNLDRTKVENSSHEGQIIKYKLLINKAAKAMMMQILKYGTTPRLESVSESRNTLVDDIHSSVETLDCETLRNSRVTLSEVPSTSSVSCSPAPTEHSMILSSPAPSEIQSSEAMITPAEMAKTNLEPGISEAIALYHSDPFAAQVSAMQGRIPIGEANVTQNLSYSIPQAKSNYVNINHECDLVVVEAGKFPSDIGMDTLNEDDKLPSINDPFWEQFLEANPLYVDLELVNSSKNEGM